MTGITTETIHAAADQLAAAGERPTLARVREALGGGSFTTISEAMKTWRQAQEAEHALAQVEIPEAVAERLEAATGALWEAAVAEAERRLQAERDALAEARAEAEAEVAEAREAVETLEREAVEREQRIEALVAERDTQAERATAERERADNLGVKLEAAEATASGLRDRLADRDRELAEAREALAAERARCDALIQRVEPSQSRG